MAKITEAQRTILAFMVKHDLRYVAYYWGPPGAEGRGAGFFWRQFPKGVTGKPKLDGRVVGGMLKRGLLEWAGNWEDLEITAAGRAAVPGGQGRREA